MWNAIHVIGCFYIGVNYPDFFTNFALPAIIFFLDIIMLHIRFIFIVWRYNNFNGDQTIEVDTEIRRKIAKFYFLLCKIF